MRDNRKLEREVAVLGDLPRETLAERWVKDHGCAPPSGVRRELLIRSAAWHLQARQLGGLSPTTRKLLKAAVADAARKLAAGRRDAGRAVADRANPGGGRATESMARDHQVEMGDPGAVAARDAMPGSVRVEAAAPVAVPRVLSPGARLVRDWCGRTHVVDVIEGGYVFEAKVYSSLTAIARKITGTHWSGPRFFGLVKR